jgi:hypothetical protein
MGSIRIGAWAASARAARRPATSAAKEVLNHISVLKSWTSK